NMRFLPPFVNTVTLQGGFTGANSYPNLVAGNAQVQTDGRSFVGSFSSSPVNFGSFSTIDPHLHKPQVQQWNLTAERVISGSLSARLSYVGTAGHRLQRSRPINLIPSGTVRPSANEADEISRIPEFTAVSQSSFGVANNRSDPRFDSV